MGKHALIISTVIFYLSLLCHVQAQGEYFKNGAFIHPGKPGPWVHQTHGDVWPKPKLIKPSGKNFSVVNPEEFIFEVS